MCQDIVVWTAEKINPRIIITAGVVVDQKIVTWTAVKVKSVYSVAGGAVIDQRITGTALKIKPVRIGGGSVVG